MVAGRGALSHVACACRRVGRVVADVGQRRTLHGVGHGPGRHVGVCAFELRAGARASAMGRGCARWPARCWPGGWARGAGACRFASTRGSCFRSAACGCGSCGPPGCLPCGHSGAGAATCSIDTCRCRCSTVVVALLASFAMGGSDRALLLGLPGLAVLAAFALPTLEPQHHGGHRLVLDDPVHAVRRCAVGHLSVGADGRAGQACSQRRTPGARIRAAVFSVGPGTGTGGDGLLDRAAALAHRPPPRGAVEEPGASRWRRGLVLAAADDAGLADPGLRAQQPSCGRTAVAARTGTRVHRRARPGAADDRGTGVFRALSGRCPPRCGADPLQLPDQGRADRQAGQAARAGHASPASSGPPTATTSSPCIGATGPLERRLRLRLRLQHRQPTTPYAQRLSSGCSSAEPIDRHPGASRQRSMGRLEARGRRRADIDPAHPRGRQQQAEGRTLARLAVDVDLAAMPLHHMLDDRQAQAGAASVA